MFGKPAMYSRLSSTNASISDVVSNNSYSSKREASADMDNSVFAPASKKMRTSTATPVEIFANLRKSRGMPSMKESELAIFDDASNWGDSVTRHLRSKDLKDEKLKGPEAQAQEGFDG